MDPKKILGVGSNATKEEITRAYREKIRKHHPDLGGDAWAFQQVQEAYESLIGPESRKQTRPTGSKPADQKARPTGGSTSRSHEGATGRPGSHSPRNSSAANAGPAGHQTATKSRPRKSTGAGNNPQSLHPEHWWHLFSRQLPLQNETTVFILINVFDIFMTYILLRFGAIEANPIANYFFQLWNFPGMIAFKLVIVAFVCVIAQFVALKKPHSARFLLIVGTLLTGAVVVYSAFLFRSHVH
jgi:hypothetical protein